MLVDLLGGDEMAPLYLIRLWGHCQNRKKCDFDNLPPAGLKALCRFQGDANAFDAALAECGFISRDGPSVTVCGWDEHNSSLVAAWENGKRGGRPRKPSGNQNETQEKPSGNPSKTQHKPSQNPAETDREEKRREEKKGEDGGNSDVPPPATPQNRKSKISDDFTPNDKHAAIAAEQGVSLAGEREKFVDHFAASGETKADWNRAFNNWLRRAKSFGGGGGKPVGETPQQRADRMARERGLM